jgi:uncharacterized membrane protein YebE (DUF533 family)
MTLKATVGSTIIAATSFVGYKLYQKFKQHQENQLKIKQAKAEQKDNHKENTPTTESIPQQA